MQVIAVIAAALVGTAAAGGYAPAPPAPGPYVPPAAPVAKPCPTPLAQPVAPVAPVVVAPAPTVTATVVAPVVVKPKAKVHTCNGWNNKYNDKACETVNDVKCTMGSGKGSKYGKCSEEVCCGSAPVAPAPVTPAPAPTTYTVITCAAFCSQQSLQCVVTTTGSCAVEGAYGQYSQCSKELCCAAPAPQPPAPMPQPQIVPCKSIVGGYGWNCYAAADYSCAVGAAYGPYPACSYGVCCIGNKPVNPCAGCNKPYGNCPDFCNPCNGCGDYCPDNCNPVDPCAGCKAPYGFCPPQCQDKPLQCDAYHPCPGVGTDCVDGVCKPVVPPVDPCADVTCPAGEHCDAGECVPDGPVDPCDGVTCGDAEHCEGGVCVPDDIPVDPCADVTCADGETCTDGVCA